MGNGSEKNGLVHMLLIKCAFISASKLIFTMLHLSVLSPRPRLSYEFGKL